MLQALIHGKLSRGHENMEDILTSNVFGLLGYLPPNDGLLPWLARSAFKNPATGEEEQPLRFLGDRATHESATVKYKFWPFWRGVWTTCEPDVVLRIEFAGRRIMVLIEAKYRSGKSSLAQGDFDVEEENEDEPEKPIGDQLAREWENLVRVAQGKGYEPHLVYLTAHMVSPFQEIAKSVNDYQNSRPTSAEPRIYSLLWRTLYEILSAGRVDPGPSIANDLRFLMERLNLTFYHGLRDLHTDEAPTLRWTFKP